MERHPIVAPRASLDDLFPARSSGWTVAWVLLAIVLIGVGMLTPAADPDLPLHLLHGTWVLGHHAPMAADIAAWTGPQPHDYSYSWFPEVVFAGLFQLGGALWLRVGLVIPMLAAAFGVRRLGRVSGWHPSVAWVIALSTGALIAGTSVGPRPVYWLVALFPMVWALATRLATRPCVSVMEMAPALGGLAAVAAVGINTHLFAPLLFVCLSALVTTKWRTRLDAKVWIAGGLAIGVGLCLTPFLPAVWRMYVVAGGSVGMMRWPRVIGELQSGYTMAQMNPEGQLVVALLGLPLLWPQRWSVARRLALGIPWALGALAYGVSARFGLVWWMLCLPMLGDLLHGARRQLAVPRPTSAKVLLPLLMAVPAGLFLMSAISFAGSARAVYAGMGGLHAPLPTISGAASTESFARLLQCALPATANPRLATHFSDGRYVAWRLQPWRVSQTTTGLFPDSVVSADRVLMPNEEPELGPWRVADVAMVQPDTRPGRYYHTDSAYVLLAGVGSTSRAPLRMIFRRELWVRRRFWLANAKPRARAWVQRPAARVGYGSLPQSVGADCRGD